MLRGPAFMERLRILEDVKMIPIALVTLFVGFCVGWMSRSIQFVKDGECANKEHPQ